MFRESVLMLKLGVSKDSGSCVWMPMLNKEIQRYGGFGERMLMSVCLAVWKAPRFLTGSKWIQGWKKLPSPSCQFWFCRDEEGLKLLSPFLWWMRNESVNSALFLLMCHPVSLLASAMKETNRVSYQRLPAQGNWGDGLWMLRYPFRARVSLRL